MGPLYFDPNAASYDSEADDVVRGNPDAYVIIDFPQTYGKIGAALLRTGRFNGTKLFRSRCVGRLRSLPSSLVPHLRGVGVHDQPLLRAPRSGTPSTQCSSGTRVRPIGNPRDQNTFDATMLCFLAAVAGNSDKPADIAKNLQRVSAAPGRTYSYLQLGAAIRVLRAGKDINYVGVGGQDDFDSKGDLGSGTYAFYKFINGDQQTLRTMNARR